MVKNRIEPTPARKEPIMNVAEITLLILIPISWLVSKSFETARMAIPILVLLISSTRATTRTITRIGVTTVTTLVLAAPICMVSDIRGIVGYCLFRPPGI